MSGRKAKVEQALRDVLSELLREVKDPRVTAAGLVSVTRVECNVDLAVARVYVSIYGSDAVAAKAIAGLTAAAGFLRGPAGRALNLAKPPELRFIHDATPVVSLQLAEILRDDEERARAVGRVPGEAPPAPPVKPVSISVHSADDSDHDEPTRDFGRADDEPTADLHPATLAALDPEPQPEAHAPRDPDAPGAPKDDP